MTTAYEKIFERKDWEKTLNSKTRMFCRETLRTAENLGLGRTLKVI